MLKFKDLFKIDYSSTGGRKLADKIFNRYNFSKDERNEVSKEIFNKGSNSND